MKKIFSIFAAVLFAGSMMAATEMTCADAAAAALGGSTDEVTVTGYVTGIASSWSSKYSNISFWLADTKDGGEVLQAFRAACAKADDAPAAGDKVKVTGKLKAYTAEGATEAIAELDAGCTFEIIERAPAPAFESLEALVAADLAAGTKVDVTFTDIEVTGFYKNSGGNRRGVYLNVKDKTGAKDLELYASTDVPADWAEGGKVSAELKNVKWDYFSRDSQWEIVVDAWSQVSYEAAATAVENTAAEVKAVKVIENGEIFIIKNGVKFNALGTIVK